MSKRSRGARFVSWLRLSAYRWFKFWGMVCDGIAVAISNFEFEVEQYERNKRLAEIDPSEQDAPMSIFPEWTGRHNPWDDQARVTPPEA